MTFNFYLKDLGTSGDRWGEGDRYVIGTEMKGLFDLVCADPNCQFSDSDFWWDPAAGSALTVIIYFVDNHAGSVLRTIRPNSPLGPGGTTLVSGGGNLSEVYLSAAAGQSDTAPALARLAFHESMHNLLNRGQSLHGVGGGGLASEIIFANTNLTQANINLLAPAVSNTPAQNTSFL
ncbi:MAG: hypothetical protein WAM53_20230 [Terrimicrobiaceae bacterium]|jgi:hypothetical protein